MIRASILRSVLFLVVLCVNVASAQSQPPSDSRALTFAAQSIAALTAGVTVADITLTGSVVWSGADTGTATLQALGTGESRMDLAVADGTRTEVRDAQTGVPLGQWINPDNASGQFAFQNCLTDPVWFYPALGSLAAGQSVVLGYIGQESRNGVVVQHLQSYIYQSGQAPGPGPTAQQLSTMDFYLDASTLLPIAVTYATHPDNDANTNLSVEIDFSGYQAMSGIFVPTHIQRYLQGNILVDLTISTASVNSGLSLSSFTIN